MERLQIDDLLHYHFLSGIKLSPDGKKAAFVVKKADWDENDYVSNLWLYRLDDESLFQLTAGGQDTLFIWLQDSQQMLFASRRDQEDEDDGDETNQEQTHMYRISIQGGEAQKAFTLPHKALSLRRVDDRRLLYTARVDLDKEAEPAADETVSQAEARKVQEKEEKDYEVLQEIPFWGNDSGFSNRQRVHLFLYDLDKDESVELTPGVFDVVTYDVRGEGVAFIAREFENKLSVVNDVYRVDLVDPQPERLTEGERLYGMVRFVDDESLVVSMTDMQPYGINQNHELYALRLADQHLEPLTPGWDTSLGNSVGTDSRLGGGPASRVDDGVFYFITTEGDSAYLNRLAPEGGTEPVVIEPGSVDSFDVTDGAVVYVAFRGNQLQELYRWQEGQEKQVSQFNRPALADKIVSTPDHFVVRAEDGTELDAWLMKPAGFKESQTYPAVIEIHGGPRTVSSHIFFHEYQVLANQGYVVFFANPRGSEGKGDAFADIRGQYGTVDYDDLMAVVDHVLAQFDFVDPTRLGVTGGSYGGFMTNWIIGHTDRFQAAVSQRGIANWTSFFLNSDIGYWFGADQMAADPWDDPDKMWFHSPLRYADRVKTPTLFIHSAEDYRCWIPEGLQMFTALKYHGVEARLCWFKGETHELSRSGKPKHRVRRLKEMAAWFERYLE